MGGFRLGAGFHGHALQLCVVIYSPPSFDTKDYARVQIAAGIEDYNQERPHSSLGYETPAAFAAELNKQWPAPLRPTGSAAQAIAYPALMRNKADRL